MSDIINWSLISTKLTGDPTYIRKSYKGKKYHAVISDIREIAKLIELRIGAFGDKTKEGAE